MEKIKNDWVNEQLAQAKVPVAVGVAVKSLLDAWNKCAHLDRHGQHVLTVFNKLVVNEALVLDSSDEQWISAQPGAIKVGDTVRVRSNAYAAEAGLLHNGRKGRVIAIRYGDIIIRTIDNIEPSLSSAHHSPHHLEKLVVRQ